MKKILFVCSENRLRSPTAEAVFSEHEGIEAIGAGTNADAETPVIGRLLNSNCEAHLSHPYCNVLKKVNFSCDLKSKK